jgi:hypothetical protein
MATHRVSDKTLHYLRCADRYRRSAGARTKPLATLLERRSAAGRGKSAAALSHAAALRQS